MLTVSEITSLNESALTNDQAKSLWDMAATPASASSNQKAFVNTTASCVKNIKLVAKIQKGRFADAAKTKVQISHTKNGAPKISYFSETGDQLFSTSYKAKDGKAYVWGPKDEVLASGSWVKDVKTWARNKSEKAASSETEAPKA